MKTKLFFLIALLMPLLVICNCAFADDPVAPINCYNAVYGTIFDKTDTGRDNAIKLCNGATSNWPVNCYNAVYGTIFAKTDDGMSEAIKLCTTATSDGPIDCYNTAYGTIFPQTDSGRTEAIDLCSRSKWLE